MEWNRQITGQKANFQIFDIEIFRLPLNGARVCRRTQKSIECLPITLGHAIKMKSKNCSNDSADSARKFLFPSYYILNFTKRNIQRSEAKVKRTSRLKVSLRTAANGTKLNRIEGKTEEKNKNQMQVDMLSSAPRFNCSTSYIFPFHSSVERTDTHVYQPQPVAPNERKPIFNVTVLSWSTWTTTKTEEKKREEMHCINLTPTSASIHMSSRCVCVFACRTNTSAKAGRGERENERNCDCANVLVASKGFARNIELLLPFVSSYLFTCRISLVACSHWRSKIGARVCV